MIPDRLGEFRILGPLGAGAMGSVHAAVEARTGRTVAIKVLSAERTVHGSAAVRFAREAEILASLDHPGIVRIDGPLRTTAGLSWLVLERIDGVDLARVLAARGALPAAEVVDLARQVLGALQHVHARGVVHRDLKPSTLLVDREGRVRVSDFGIAALADSAAITATGGVLGTPAYSAPEQSGGAPVDGRTDLYALAACLHEALAGRRPFEADDARELRRLHEIAPPAPLRATVPEPLAAAIRQALAKDPDDRIASAREFLEALEELPALPVGLPEAPRPARRNPRRLATLVAAGVVVAAGAIRLTDRPRPQAADPPRIEVRVRTRDGRAIEGQSAGLEDGRFVVRLGGEVVATIAVEEVEWIDHRPVEGSGPIVR